MATYVNDLRLTELATGEGSGTWGVTTNTNLELIGEALGYGTQDCFATDADATTTVADGATDPARAMYFKVTSSATLTATRTLTIGPNTVSRVMLIENATTGSQSIAISQGSGGNVTIASGQVKMVYLDGAGSGAAVVDAMASLELGTITVANLTATTADINGGTIDGATIGGASAGAGTFTNLTATGTTTLAGASTTANITFGDNDKAIFGAGSDLEIYHDGSNSYITDSGTGNLRISGTLLQLNDASFNKYLLGSGDSVTLYNADSPKLATTATGIDVTGTVTADGLTVSKASGDIASLEGTGTTADVEANLVFNPVYDVNARIVSAREGAALTSRLSFETGTANDFSTTERLRIAGNGDISFYEDTGTTPKFFWDASAERLGLGLTSPAYALEIEKSSADAIKLRTTAATTASLLLDVKGGATTLTSTGLQANNNGSLSVLTGTTSAAEAMRITSAGDVGIGTTSPSTTLVVSQPSDNTNVAIFHAGGGTTNRGLKISTFSSVNSNAGVLLDAQTTIGGAALAFATAGTERMRIDASGNVGIGTSSPASRLEISNANTGADAAGPIFTITNESQSVTAADIALGEIDFVSNDPSSGATGVGGSLGVFSERAFDGGPASTYLSFSTRSSSTVAEKVRITSAGNVGIGTASPEAPIDVEGSGALVANFNGTAANGGYVRFQNNSTSIGDIGAGAQVLSGGTAGDFAITSRSGNLVLGTGTVERARIDSSGNVGIGTSSPSSRLTVESTSSQSIIMAKADVSTSGTDAGITFQTGVWPKASIYGESTNAGNANGLLIFKVGSGVSLSEAMRINSSGDLMVGTTSMGLGTHRSYFLNDSTNPCSAFVNATGTANTTSTITLYHGAASGATSARMASFINQAGSGVGTIESTGSATSYNTSSDYRLKDVDGPITNSGAYIDALKPVQGSWKADGSRFIGLIAHEVQEVSETQIATGEKDGEEMQGMDYSAPELIANLIAEIQSLRARVHALESK